MLTLASGLVNQPTCAFPPNIAAMTARCWAGEVALMVSTEAGSTWPTMRPPDRKAAPSIGSAGPSSAMRS